jgi:hypothetical protein
MKKCSGHLDRRTRGLGWQKTGQSVTPPGVRQVLRGCELCDHDGAEPLGRQGGVLAVGSIDRFSAMPALLRQPRVSSQDRSLVRPSRRSASGVW